MVIAVAFLMFLAKPCLAQSGIQIRDTVQHFGPLLIVASHEPAPDPEETARVLLDKGGPERLRALQSMGLESDAEVNALWLSLLNSHEGVSAEAFLQGSFSTGVPNQFFGEGIRPQKRVSAGFDTLSEQPFWIEAIYSQTDGQWYRIATIACWCDLMEVTEPAKSLSSKRALKPEELVFRMNVPPTNDIERHLREIRFRLREGVLKPVMEYEAESWNCPEGHQSGQFCTRTVGNLTRSQLMDNGGNTHAGAVLATGTQTSHMGEKEIPRLKWLTCTPYAWNEVAFRYEISEWKGASCKGLPPEPKSP